MIRKIGIQSTLNQIEINQNNKRINEIKATSKVEEIKKAIANGTYKIDIEKTAKAMAKELLKE